MSWTPEQIELLIEEYQKHTCLYAVKHRNYHNKHVRSLALNSIVQTLSIIKPNVTAMDIQRKFLGLRTTYTAERRKVVSSIRNGMEEDEVYKPALWYYSKMEFLNEHLNVRNSSSSFSIREETPPVKDPPSVVVDSLDPLYEVDVQTLEADYPDVLMYPIENTEEATTSSASTSTTVSGATVESKPMGVKRRYVARDTEILSQISKSLKEVAETIIVKKRSTWEKTEEDIFGELVAAKLKTITNADKRATLQHKIYCTLYERLQEQ